MRVYTQYIHVHVLLSYIHDEERGLNKREERKLDTAIVNCPWRALAPRDLPLPFESQFDARSPGSFILPVQSVIIFPSSF